jgi:hypothetical protein
MSYVRRCLIEEVYMKRIGAAAVLLGLFLLILSGCEEETTGVEEKGLEIAFTNCLSFGVYVWVDGLFQGYTSTDEPKLFEIPSGSHTLYARSNAIKEGSYYCWSTNVSVSDSGISTVTLDCTGAECQE